MSDQNPASKTASKPPFDIRPGERYTDGNGRTWEPTDHEQWKEIKNGEPQIVERGARSAVAYDEARQTLAIPEIARPWYDWFAIFPVKTIDGERRWLRWVQKRRVWMVIWSTEYRDV